MLDPKKPPGCGFFLYTCITIVQYEYLPSPVQKTGYLNYITV